MARTAGSTGPGDDQWRVILVGGEDIAERMSQPRRRMQIHERGIAGSLRKAVRHANDQRLLQPEHVAKIIRKMPEHRQLGRTGIAKDRGHADRAQELERCLAHRLAHVTSPRDHSAASHMPFHPRRVPPPPRSSSARDILSRWPSLQVQVVEAVEDELALAVPRRHRRGTRRTRLCSAGADAGVFGFSCCHI
jgi:hypothetical protein